MPSVDEIIALAGAARVPSPEGPDVLMERARRLAAESAFELVEIGSSSAGRTIGALHWPGEGKRVVAWGYPHPDEPLGAMALSALCEMLASGESPHWLSQIDWWIVLCADPDQAALNTWAEDFSLTSYIEGNWRPLYSGLEVDYHFPVNHPPFFQPRGRALGSMNPPLPESCALADLLDRVRPDLLCLMHSNHVAGAYDYFLHRPSPDLLEDLDRACDELSVPRHRGERPDPGRRVKRARPDFLYEFSLSDRLKKAERQFGDIEGLTLAGCVSAAQYLETVNPDGQVITPEAGLWRPEAIDDLSPTPEKRTVTVRRFKKGAKWREGLYGQLRGQEICYQTSPASGPSPERQEEVPLTRGMAGVEAVELRRQFLSQADEIWEKAEPLLEGQDSRWLRERRAVTVPGSRVNDRSMLIFRADEAYRRQATVAEEADLRLRWGMQSCLWLSHSLQLYRNHGLSKAAEAQEELLKEARDLLLGELEERPDLYPAARSQLARILISASG